MPGNALRSIGETCGIRQRPASKSGRMHPGSSYSAHPAPPTVTHDDITHSTTPERPSEYQSLSLARSAKNGH